MNSELIFICISAFITVFVVLGVLAGIMRLILYFFPAETGDQAVVVAAISAAVQKVYPGVKITKIEEIK
ncbi:MAG TPA: hypothetical protein ENJ89_03680 [Caldithrix abyssi]|uniref:Uncharacterized protein n=1 Tax=Caldithrix abyssi TaxID=187145 RepID=A0A7V5UEB7_CALAY|nr:hypothetical protein [Caldithrix abyssi]